MDSTSDIGQLIAGLPQTEPRVLARARDSMINGRNDLALQILELAVAKSPSSNLRIAFGHVLARDRRYKDAMGHMVAILREEPRNSEALLLLTDALLECGEYDRAGKMLDRAMACSADRTECQRLSEKLSNLTGETATNVVGNDLSPHESSTRPEHDALSRPRGHSDFEVDNKLQIDPVASSRPRVNTMQGAPVPQWDVGDPRGESPSAPLGVPAASATPETLQSGTFSTLDGWSEDDTTIDSGLYPGPDMGALPPADGDLGAVISEAFDDFEIQDTMAFVPEDFDDETGHEYANPTDQTAAIIFDDDDVEPLSSPVERAPGDMPSIEYEQVFEAEIHAEEPGIYDEPTREREAWREPNGEPTRDDVPSRRGMTPLPQSENPQSIAPPFETARPADHNPQSGKIAGGFQAPAPAYDAPEQQQLVANPFGAPTFENPDAPAPRRSEPTGLTPAGAVSQESRAHGDKGDAKPSKRRRWLPFVTGVGVLVALVLGAIGLVIYASHQQSEDIARMLTRADSELEPDTYRGHLAALESLDQAVQQDSFLGPSLDEVLVDILPPMGKATATDLKRQAIVRRAYIAAFVEFRFEQSGSQRAEEFVSKAEALAPEVPHTMVGRAYLDLASGRPHDALTRIETDSEATAANLMLDQVRIDAQLNLDQPAAAAAALKNFRTLEQPTLYQKLLAAQVDLALGDPAAQKTVKEIRNQSPNHVDARIAQAYLTSEGDESKEELLRSLKAVETKLKESASTYQLAQTSIARGYVHESAGNATEAEKAYRNGIRKLPKRPELYLPLIRLKFAESEYEAVDELLQKAKDEGASHPLHDIERAKLRVLDSKPEVVIDLLSAATFEDGRKDFLIGLAHLELDRLDEARKSLETAQKRPSETPGAAAFVHVVDARQNPEKAEDATYQVDRLASKHPKNAFVHWASALVRLAMADQMENREAFEGTLDKAEKELEEAIRLEPGWPLFHFTLCDVNLRGLEGKDAARACETGQELAPNYVPGLITFAELHLQQGDFEEAQSLLARLTELRPNNDRVAVLAARTAIELGNHEKAEKTINAMLGKPLSNGFEMKLLEGRLAFAQRNYAKAAGYLASAHDLRPQDGEAGVLYAITLTRLGKHDDAEEVLQGHLRDRIWSAAAWTTFGEIRRRQGRFKDAFENLGIAAKKLDDAPMPKARTSELYLQSALTYRDRHNWRHPAVLARLKRAIERGDPDDPEVHYTMGLYHLNQKRPNENAAAQSMQKVVEKAPWRCDAYKALVSLYKKLDEDKRLEALAEAPVAEQCKDSK